MIVASRTAKTLVTQGFTGNGCGNRRWNCLIAVILQWWAKVDFSPACLVHDAERSITTKSEKHRLLTDGYFMLNLTTCCKDAENSDRAKKVARLFYWAVITHSYNTYYK